ncbi:hypothetical protein GCM10010416_70320 [Streptomyces caniferus]
MEATEAEVEAEAAEVEAAEGRGGEGRGGETLRAAVRVTGAHRRLACQWPLSWVGMGRGRCQSWGRVGGPWVPWLRLRGRFRVVPGRGWRGCAYSWRAMGQRPFRSGEGATARSEESTGGRFVDPGGRAMGDAEGEEGGGRCVGERCDVGVPQRADAQEDGGNHQEQDDGRSHRHHRSNRDR